MADYISQFTGSEIDARLAKVSQLESGKQDNLVSGTNIKTINGQSVLGGGNLQIQAGDTDAVKYVAQTLTDAQKAQARANIDAASLEDIQDMDFVTATTLPTASASTMGHIYLIGPDTNNNYDRYFTQESSGSYSWVSLGSTEIDLSTYATQEELNQLEAKVDDISTGKYYGYYATANDLPEDVTVDGFAYVGSGPTYTIYNCEGGVWTSSNITVNQSPVGNDEDIDQNEDGKLQFANRTYNALQPNGMGYKILRKDASFASQVTDTNTIYEIRYHFALSSTFTMPAGCVLLFEGGKVTGAALQGNRTILAGDVMIEMPKGSFTSFRSSWCISSDYAKLKNILSLDVDELVFDEDISVASFSGTIQTDIAVISGNNHKITINTDCSSNGEAAIFIQCGATRSVKDLSLDFTNHNVACGIYSDARADLSISGIRVENIKSSLINSNWGISGIFVKTYDSLLLSIRDIVVKEIGALGNGTPNDNIGPVTGICVLNVGLNSTVNIGDIVLNHIYNYNSGGTEISDDASGIYVSNLSTNTNESRIYIGRINAENYGRRCLKLDAKNVTINGLYANQTGVKADVVVGFNDGGAGSLLSGDVCVKDTHSYGECDALVSTSVLQTTLENCLFDNTSTSRNRSLLRFQNSSAGQVGYIQDCVANNSLLVYSDSTGRSKVYVNGITINSNTGSIGYLAGLKNTEVYINGYTFTGSVRTAINFLSDSTGSRLHISGATIVCNQGYNAIFNSSSPLDFKLTDFVISGYFQGVLDLSSCLYAEVSNGFVEYLGNTNNLVTGIGTVKLASGTAVIRNVAKKVASGVSYLYGSRIGYTGDGTIEIFMDESAAPFNTETKGKVYTKTAFVEMYNRDMTIPASVTGAKMKINNPYTDVPICAEYAGGWRISNAVAVNNPTDATNQVTGYGAGSLLYCKSITKMILYNGTTWINMDGTALS